MSSGELAFIEWLTRQSMASPSVPLGIGDDCAVVRIGGHDVLVTTDMLLNGTHFDTARHSPEQIGHKSMACSLSDIAAMAGRPIAAVVAVGLPRGFGLEFAQRVYRGMTLVADRFACPIVGGDTTSWTEPLSVCVTMLGECPDGRTPIRRNGAQVGDRICVTGPLGGSILRTHLEFEPRIELADALARTCRLHALMDISDGLAIDLFRICQASAVGAIVEESRVCQVISPAAEALSAQDGVTPLHHALNDGEDFELLVVMPDQAIPHELEMHLFPVGRIVDAGFRLHRTDGTVIPLEPQGYEHTL